MTRKIDQQHKFTYKYLFVAFYSSSVHFSSLVLLCQRFSSGLSFSWGETKFNSVHAKTNHTHTSLTLRACLRPGRFAGSVSPFLGPSSPPSPTPTAPPTPRRSIPTFRSKTLPLLWIERREIIQALRVRCLGVTLRSSKPIFLILGQPSTTLGSTTPPSPAAKTTATGSKSPPRRAACQNIVQTIVILQRTRGPTPVFYLCEKQGDNAIEFFDFNLHIIPFTVRCIFAPAICYRFCSLLVYVSFYFSFQSLLPLPLFSLCTYRCALSLFHCFTASRVRFLSSVFSLALCDLSALLNFLFSCCLRRSSTAVIFFCSNNRRSFTCVS